MNLLIKNARVVDPSQELDAKLDVLIEDGQIARIDKRIKASVETIDAEGLAVRMAVLYLLGGAHNVE